METKTCSKCNECKSLDNFQFRKDNGKYRNECKACKSKTNKQYRDNTQYTKGEKRLEVRREANKAEVKVCVSCNVSKSLDNYAFRTDTNSYRNQCKDCRNLYVKEVKKQEKHRKKQNERAQERRRTDPCFLINQRLRARLRKVLVSKKAKRQTEFYELLGCSCNEFKKYIEQQFVDDMSWELRNFELDHKIPCAFFDMTDVEHQKKCFNYTNFQPLKPDVNNKKSDCILEEHMEYLFSIMF